MLLTETTIRQAKPALRALKLFDGRGLFLLLQPTGSRYWRFKYRINGKEKLRALGVYPDVPLKLARERRALSKVCSTVHALACWGCI